MAKNTTKDEQETLDGKFKNHSNKNAEEVLKESVLVDNRKVKATQLFINEFNNLLHDINTKIDKELEKPKYRFIDTVFTADEANKLIDNIIEERELFEQYGYTVEILNNIECTDVSKESKYTIRISKLDGAFVDIDLLEYQENIKDFTFDEIKFITEKIARIEGYINQQIKNLADIIADYLGFIMHFKVLHTLIYKKIGWYKYNYISDKYMWIFKYDRVYSKMQDMSQYITGRCMRGYIDGIEEKEDNAARDIESEWIRTTVGLLNKYDYDCLILGAGISGLVRQLLPYTKESNININIVGKPASGKSTICHYLLGIFGNPEMLEGSFTDTDNKMEENRAKRPILPYVLDERMLKIESESDQAKKRILLMNIFREYEGKAKEKVGKQYEDISGERTYGPIISSSVRSMMDYIIELDDLGQFRRFIELDVGGRDEKKLFSSAEEASEIERIAYDNYGFGIRIIVDYMLELLNKDDNDEINERYNTLCNNIGAKLKKEETGEIRGLEASSKRFALIVLSYQILREALIFIIKEMNEKEGVLKFDIKGNAEDERNKEYNSIIIDKTDDIEKILIDNLVSKMQMVCTVQKPKDNKGLLEYILKYKDIYFKEIDKTLSETEELRKMNEGELLGTYERTESNITLFTIEKYRLDMFWYMESIPEPSIIIEFINEVKNKKLKKDKAVELGKKYNASTLNAYGDKDRTSRTLNKQNIQLIKNTIDLKIMKEVEATKSKATKAEKESDKQ